MQRFILAHKFQKSQSMKLDWLHYFKLVARQKYHGGQIWVRKADHLLLAARKHTRRLAEEGPALLLNVRTWKIRRGSTPSARSPGFFCHLNNSINYDVRFFMTQWLKCLLAISTSADKPADEVSALDTRILGHFIFKHSNSHFLKKELDLTICN